MHNYKLLKPLLILLQTRSLTESANQLNVTQSAMSRTLAQIRDAFDDPILVRQGKGFVITARGSALLEELPSLLNQIDSLYSPTEFNPALCEKQFVIAYTAFISDSIAPLISQQLHQYAPNASLSSELWQQKNLDSLLDSSIEILAATLDHFPENIHGKELIQDEYVAVLHPNNPLAKKPLNLSDYLNAQHVTVHGMLEMKQRVNDVFSQHQYSRQILASVPSFSSAMDILQQSNALVTAPLHIAGKYPQLKISKLPFDLPMHRYFLLWHAKHQQDPAHRWFRELCFEQLQRHLQQTQLIGREQLSQ